MIMKHHPISNNGRDLVLQWTSTRLVVMMMMRQTRYIDNWYASSDQTIHSLKSCDTLVSSIDIAYIFRYCRLFVLHLLYWLSTHCCYLLLFFSLLLPFFPLCIHRNGILWYNYWLHTRLNEGSSQYVGLNWFVFISKWFVSRQVRLHNMRYNKMI